MPALFEVSRQQLENYMYPPNELMSTADSLIAEGPDDSSSYLSCHHVCLSGLTGHDADETGSNFGVTIPLERLGIASSHLMTSR